MINNNNQKIFNNISIINIVNIDKEQKEDSLNQNNNNNNTTITFENPELYFYVESENLIRKLEADISLAKMKNQSLKTQFDESK
jgi:hypothetical protein